jgi:hypothetical protein
MIKDKEIKMDKNTMLELMQSELNAEWGNEKLANYALTGILSALVDKVVLEKYITTRGWNK